MMLREMQRICCIFLRKIKRVTMEDSMAKDSKLNRVFQKPWMGLLFFLVSLVALLFVGGMMQYYWGMLGMALTEIMILMFAIGGVLLSGQKFKEVFPFKFDNGRHLMRQIIGTAIFWVGSFLLVMGANVIIMSFFPEQLTDTSQGLSDFFQGIHPVIGFLIVACMPAVCEEALHRGYIQSTMKNIKRDWVVVLIMGVVFGVFHLDPVRFLGTAILGAALAYLMVKTRNFLLPILFHFLNNAFSFSVSQLVSVDPETATGTVSSVNNITLIAAALFYLSVAPVLLLLGAYLIRKKVSIKALSTEDAKKVNMKKLKCVIIALVVSAGLFGSGVVVAALSILSQPDSVYLTKSVDYSITNQAFSHDIELDKETEYIISATFSESDGMTQFQIVDSDGKTYVDETGADFSISGMQLTLEAGAYHVIVKPDDETLQELGTGETVSTKFTVTMVQMPG